MHKYLRAIGFSGIKKEELEQIFEQIIKAPPFQNLRNCLKNLENFSEYRFAAYTVKMIHSKWSITIRIYVGEVFLRESRRR